MSPLTVFRRVILLIKETCQDIKKETKVSHITNLVPMTLATNENDKKEKVLITYVSIQVIKVDKDLAICILLEV